MMEYSIIFALSFTSYLFVLIALPYISAQTWADMFFLIFLMSVIYQLFYIFWLRKKDGVSLLRSIARVFLYSLWVLNLFHIIELRDAFINGYTVMAWGGYVVSNHIGFDAWNHMGLDMSIYKVTLVISLIYSFIYIILSLKIRKKQFYNNY